MNLLLVTRDLMLSSRVEGIARNLGYSVSNVGDMTGATSTLSENDNCRLIFVDLQLPGLDILELVKEVRSSSGTETIIVACGPHVHEQRLNEAREAGCDRVVSKGQFERDAKSILTV